MVEMYFRLIIEKPESWNLERVPAKYRSQVEQKLRDAGYIN